MKIRKVLNFIMVFLAVSPLSQVKFNAEQVKTDENEKIVDVSKKVEQPVEEVEQPVEEVEQPVEEVEQPVEEVEQPAEEVEQPKSKVEEKVIDTCSDKTTATSILKYTCDENGYVKKIQELEKTSNKVVSESFYDGTQSYNEADLSASLIEIYQYTYNTNGTLRLSTQSKNGMIIREIFYKSGTIFGANNSLSIDYEFLYTYNTDSTIKFAEKREDGFITRKYYYQSDTKYGNHGTKITTMLFVYYRTNGKLFFVENYDNVEGKVTFHYGYNETTPYSGMEVNYLHKYIFSYNADGTLRMLQRVNNSDDKVYQEDYYVKGTKYSTDHLKSIDYSYKFTYNSNATLNYAEKIDNNQISVKYFYASGTTYGEHGSKITRTLYIHYRTNGNLFFVENYDNIGKKITFHYGYNETTPYSGMETNYLHKFNFSYNEDGTLRMLQRVRNSDEKVYQEDYYVARTKYSTSHLDSIDYSYTFKYNSNSTLYMAERIDGGKVRTQYYYDSGVYFNSERKFDYVYNFYYHSNGNLNYANRVENGKSVMVYYYLTNTQYNNNHGGRIQFTVASNGTVSNNFDVFWRPQGTMTCGWGCYSGHYGMDFDNGVNSSVRASMSGRVVEVNTGCSKYTADSSCGYGWGNYVLIDHGHGKMTRYAHLANVNLSKGEHVRQGWSVGTQGNSGHSFGSHMHLELLVNGSRQNPENYFEKKTH